MSKRWIAVGSVVIIIGIFAFLIQSRFLDQYTWDSWSLPLSGKIIYIDPGHGGPDGGADSGKAIEKDIALSVSLKLRDYLQQQGALVLMTREYDHDLADQDTKGLSRRKTEDLQRRAKLINDSHADFYISIHLNAIPSSRWHGAQTFYHEKFIENKIAAELIQDELIDNLQNTNRKAKPINHVYLLKTVEKPGALVEIGFLSNPTERDLLQTDEYQEKVAISIYEGIMRYFTDEKKKRLKMEKNED